MTVYGVNMILMMRIVYQYMSLHIHVSIVMLCNGPIVLKIINATRKLWFLVGDLYIFGTIQWKGAILGGLD
jgi:hypothetical protein